MAERPRRFLLVVAAALAAGVTAAAATGASPYNPQKQITSADQNLARSIVIVKSDLGKPWKGGYIKPTYEGDDCVGAKQSDLVLTGSASTDFKRSGGEVSSDVWVLQTPQMVQLDRQRQPGASVEAGCLRQLYTPGPSYRIESVKRLPFPHLGSYTDPWRVTFFYPNAGPSEQSRSVDDYVDISIGRIEISLYVSAPWSERDNARTAEIALGKLLVARATPPRILKYTLPLPSLSPVAGKDYALRGILLKPDRVHGEDNTGMVGVLVPPDTVTCTATLEGAELTGTGKGGCRWQLPADSNGEHLLVVAEVTLGDGGMTIRLPLTVG